jgi:NADPH:quinone reductase-like Zn-dependent oxidoreductase
MPGNMMRAARFHAYGPPENLVIEEVPRPELQAGEVLVRVHAAGVNPVDWKIRRGYLKDFMPVPLPFTPGLDLAGTVAAVGPDVTTVQPGQAVFGRGSGAYAEYALAPANALAPKPHALSFDQAATIPVGASTAWAGIFDVGGLQAGQRLLVHGAAGGVGLYAVQFGRWTGAEVIGTASTGNVAFVRSLGAQTVVDYTTTPFESVVREVDVVLDPIGGETQERSWQVLKPGGILVAVASPAAEETARRHGVLTSGVRGQPTTDLLRRIADLIESGAVVAPVGKVFPLAEAGQAQALSETGHGQGRIILHIAD